MWKESILSPRTVERMLAGKDYNNGYSSSQDHSSGDLATASTAPCGLYWNERQQTKRKSREVSSLP